jgi:hypothetical protein
MSSIRARRVEGMNSSLEGGKLPEEKVGNRGKAGMASENPNRGKKVVEGRGRADQNQKEMGKKASRKIKK